MYTSPNQEPWSVEDMSMVSVAYVERSIYWLIILFFCIPVEQYMQVTKESHRQVIADDLEDAGEGNEEDHAGYTP